MTVLPQKYWSQAGYFPGNVCQGDHLQVVRTKSGRQAATWGDLEQQRNPALGTPHGSFYYGHGRALGREEKPASPSRGTEQAALGRASYSILQALHTRQPHFSGQREGPILEAPKVLALKQSRSAPIPPCCLQDECLRRPQHDMGQHQGPLSKATAAGKNSFPALARLPIFMHHPPSGQARALDFHVEQQHGSFAGNADA